MDWFLRLLLMRDVLGDQGSVHWPPHFPALSTPLMKLVFVAAAVACAVLIWQVYKREAAYVPLARKRLLGGLRFASVLVLLFILTGAYLNVTRSEDTKGTLLFLVDQSQSMALVDRRTEAKDIGDAKAIFGTIEADKLATTATRGELVKRAMANPTLSLLPKLAEHFRIDAFTFGQSAGVAPFTLSATDGGQANPAGAFATLAAPAETATQLGPALSDAVRRNRGRKLDGVVVFTDGGANRGDDPLELAKHLGVPVYAVGVGLPQAKDLEVPFMFCENVLFKGDNVQVTVRVKQRGYAGRSVKLTIRREEQGVRDGQIVKEQTVTLGNDLESTHTIIINADKVGVFTYSATVEVQADEANPDNNRRTRSGVRVIDRKIRVLLADDSPRWEFRFIKSVLEADKQRLNPSWLLRSADPGGDGQLTAFPPRPQDLRPYDVIILGNLSADVFTRDELKALADWVQNEGGSLICIAGRTQMPDRYKGTVLEDLLPIEFEPLGVYTVDDELTRTLKQSWRPMLTPEGKAWPALRLAVDATENDTLWAKAEPFFWCYPVTKLKPGAQVLIAHPDRRLADGPLPVMASQRVGKGQVLWLGADETWRFRHEPGAAAHRRFWGQVVTTMAMTHLIGGASRIQIETDRSEYAVGDQAQVIARVYDKNYVPVTTDTVTLQIEKDLTREQATLTKKPNQPGVYTGTWPASAEGRFRMTLLNETEGEAVVTVAAPQLEMEDPGLHEALLKELASTTGGKFVYLHQLDQLRDALTNRDRVTSERRDEITLWNAPGVMVALALLLGLEWFLRKRSDLL